jgi:hypothetical protein
VPIDTDTAGSPGWWLKTLAGKLHDRRRGRGWSPTAPGPRRARPGLDLLDDYLAGDPPLPHVADGWREALRPFIRLARMNYAELVVESARERMIPLGFGTAADDDRSGDSEAARVYAANSLDLVTADVFLWMLEFGDAYMIVGPRPGADDGDPPLITAEDPREVITAEDPATGRTLAGVKVFRDEWDDRDLAYVYLPGEVHVAVRRGSASIMAATSYRFGGRQWEWDDSAGGKPPAGFDDLIGVHRFRNRRGVGEYEPHLDVLDRINDTLFERLAVAKYQAFRQRAAIGLPDRYPPDHPNAGELIDYSQAFLADPGAFWSLPPGVTMWEGNSIDLGPIRLAVKDDVEALAAVTRTPLHYITPDAASGSAEGASTMREGLVYRVEDRRRRAAAALARAMSTAFRIMGRTDRADVLKIRTLWQPAERYSLAERMSSATQAKAAGLPQESIYTDVMGYGPDDLDRLQRERARDLLYAPATPAPLTGTAAAPAPSRSPAAPPATGRAAARSAPAPG